MTVDVTVFTALTGLVAGRCFPDPPDVLPARPYIVFTKVGGQSINFLDGSDPGKSLPRIQVNAWGDTRSQIEVLAKQIEVAMRAVPQTEVLAEPVWDYDDTTKLRGSMQEFSLVS